MEHGATWPDFCIRLLGLLERHTVQLSMSGKIIFVYAVMIEAGTIAALAVLAGSVPPLSLIGVWLVSLLALIGCGGATLLFE
jgi:hypothetical protein